METNLYKIFTTLLMVIVFTTANSTDLPWVDHLFSYDSGAKVEFNILINDERECDKNIPLDVEESLTHYLQENYPSNSRTFVHKIGQLKRNGDFVNLVVTIKKSSVDSTSTHKCVTIDYRVNIYDVSQTPIYIRDGKVSHTQDLMSNMTQDDCWNEAIRVANKKLIDFIRRGMNYSQARKQKNSIIEQS